MLVRSGATAQGPKARVAWAEGVRARTASWQAGLQNLQRRGRTAAPALAGGAGALGCWGAWRARSPSPAWQRGWVHTTGNVVDNLPKRPQSQATRARPAIWRAATHQEADRAVDAFLPRSGATAPTAAEGLATERDTVLTVSALPAEHWIAVRTPHPLESTCAPVRWRTVKTRTGVSRRTVLTRVFTRCQRAPPRGRRRRGGPRLAEVLRGVPFVKGVNSSRPAEGAAGQQALTIAVTSSAA